MLNYEELLAEEILEGNGLDGPDGNAFSIMGRVSEAIKKAGGTQKDTEQYTNEATASDYENLKQVSLNWLNKFGY